MKIGKVPPPEHVRGSLHYLGTWNGHSIYKDTMSENTCRYLCKLGHMWYRSPSVRDLLALPLPVVANLSLADKLSFVIAAIDETLLSVGEREASPDIRQQLTHVTQLLLAVRVQVQEIRSHEAR